jgi:hypothetical protein
MEDDLKILKVEYLSNHCMDREFILEENSEEISSVALLSPACFNFKLQTFLFLLQRNSYSLVI